MENKITIAFLGLGAIGSRMAAHLLKAGYHVIVWNRTAAAAEPLVKAGAQQAQTPREAAAGANVVISMLRDDEASRQVWLDPENGSLSAITQDTLAIESATLTPAWVKELGQAAAAKGIPFLEAPVSGSLPQAEAAQLVFLVGGDEAAFKRAEPILKTMGSTIQYVGALGTGALIKLSTNALLGIQVAAYAELIGLLKRSGTDAARAMEAISKTSVWAPVANYLTGFMLTGNNATLFPVKLLEKDFNYMLSTAARSSLGADASFASSSDMPMTTAVQQVLQKAIDQGLGQENMTSVVKLFTR